MNNANEAAGASMAASGTVATASGALHDMEHHGKLGIFRLVASVITLILGAGVFTLSGIRPPMAPAAPPSSRLGASRRWACCVWS